MAGDSDITNDKPPGDTTLEKIGSSIPGVKQFLNSAKIINEAIESEEVAAANALSAVVADLASLGLEVNVAIHNPIGLLVNMGLDLVLNLVEPLNKLLTWLSGDPNKMTDLQERWRQFKDTLIVMREEVDAAWQNALATSQSPTTEAAKDKVNGMAAAIGGIAFEIAQIESHLGVAQSMSKAIYEFVKALLSALVEQLIIYGLVALALASTTGGVSVLRFLMWATQRSANATATACVTVALVQFSGHRLWLIGQEVLNSTFRLAGADLLMWAGGMVSNWVGGIQKTGVPTKGVTQEGSVDPSIAMAHYINVDPAEFDECADELRRLVANADALATKVSSDTVTDFWVWGLACQGFVDGYNQNRSEIAADVALIAPALEGNATRFDAVATSYRDADNQAAAKITRAGSK